MTNITKLKFAALDISDKNYLLWVSMLISILSQKNNELLMKNHRLRPTGSVPLFEENGTALPETNAISRHGCGHWFGYGRRYARGVNHGRNNQQSYQQQVSSQLGGGYLFGLPVGFVADSIGATIGSGAAFLLGRTIGRSFVISKLKDYPQFNAVAIAIRKSGFKIVLLLRLVPLLPFNVLNYLLSVTPVSIGHYMLASWLGMMPITFALVYVGTTLKDLSDVTHGWGEFSKTRWALIVLGLVVSVVLIICVTRVAKAALKKALAENEDVD
ncbi:uncharacterized protein LOC111392939, partial [Olea europaea var. sylvestris]|uniref:uncharacterized protein LOC111392939 n=1 Tax=Olea europaea var. sylvestris TaxID=158386 RepID=UPI000C1D1FB1